MNKSNKRSTAGLPDIVVVLGDAVVLGVVVVPIVGAPRVKRGEHFLDRVSSAALIFSTSLEKEYMACLDFWDTGVGRKVFIPKYDENMMAGKQLKFEVGCAFQK